MRHFLVVILTIFISVSYGQNFSYPLIKANGKKVNDFVPVGWTILDTTFGDLNNDNLKDAAVILQLKNSVALENELGDTVLTQPRILLLLFKSHTDNNFRLIEQSNSFILKHDNSAMDDPYQEIMIKKGVLNITFNLFYNAGSWYVTTAVYKFRYQQKKFVLIGADNFSFHRATHDYEEYSYNFLTKKRVLTKGNDNNGTKKTISTPVNIPMLKTLETFIQPFTWQVEKDIFL